MLTQETFNIPELSNEEKREILYNHVIAYAITGIGFAKSKGSTPNEFGIYIGLQFVSFWDPNEDFQFFVKEMLKILNGIHPNNEMHIISQTDKMIKFKLKNVDLWFQNGPVFGVSYDEYLECSHGIITALANHMNVSFMHKICDKHWYEVIFEAM